MMRLTHIAAGIALAAASVASANPAAKNASDAGFKPMDMSGRSAEALPAVGVLWNNGAFNGMDGSASELGTMIADARTADDFTLCEGAWHKIDSIVATMICSGSSPDAVLELYADCNGVPSTLIASYEMDSAAVQTGPGGYDVVDFTFVLDEWFPAGRYWVSAVGLGDGMNMDRYWFGISQFDKAVGSTSKFKSDHFGQPDWGHVDLCCEHDCAEMAFVVNGYSCDILCDNGGPDYNPMTAGRSEQDTSAQNARTVDNFVVKTESDVEVCFVQAYIYTNCPTFTGKLDIFSDACDVPGDCPIATFDASTVIDLNQTVTINGVELDAYCLQFKIEGLTLTAGTNYWLSAYARGTGFFGTRSYFAGNGAACTKISDGRTADFGIDGCVKFPTTARVEPGDDVTLADLWNHNGNDNAFLIAANAISGPPAIQPLMGDLNADGRVNFDDLNLLLDAFGSIAN